MLLLFWIALHLDDEIAAVERVARVEGLEDLARSPENDPVGIESPVLDRRALGTHPGSHGAAPLLVRALLAFDGSTVRSTYQVVARIADYDVAAGRIGGLAADAYSFVGAAAQLRVRSQFAPDIAERLNKYEVEAALSLLEEADAPLTVRDFEAPYRTPG